VTGQPRISAAIEAVVGTRPKVWPGRSYPLGALFDGYGTNFAVFSSVAERVELCLFDGVETRIDLTCGTGQVWHAYLPEVGHQHALRVSRPTDRGTSRAGCAATRTSCSSIRTRARSPKASSGAPRSAGIATTADRRPRTARRTRFRSVVVQPYFDWGNDRRLEIPWNETVIYEVHVKGFTHRHPEIPEPLRGTYGGLAHPAAIAHLKSLGVTAVELLPIHAFVHDGFLLDKGLRNYWGYHSIGYFAPHPEYASVRSASGAVAEVKHMVKTLHQHGIEVILDVVYNHTGEGNHEGRSFSMKGLDNAAYYRLVDDKPGFYKDYTGTGNTLNMRHPHTLQLVMDSLRYWIEEIHVDGFRFDLASSLARGLHEVDRLGAFFDLTPAGSRRLARQADRGAVGRRRRRLSGRQLSAAVERVEREVPRLDPRLLARRAGLVARARIAADRIG